MNDLKRIVCCSLLALLAACASQESGSMGPLMVQQTAMGDVLSDSHGMTLYTLKSDPVGETTCYKRCARAWPPMLATAGAAPSGDLGLVKRKDGKMQWAWRGKPLYRWMKDKKPGDTTGHKVGDVWFVARP